MSASRYIVEAPTHGGRWFAECGWRVCDTQPIAIECAIVASGKNRDMQRWARDLNASSEGIT